MFLLDFDTFFQLILASPSALWLILSNLSQESYSPQNWSYLFFPFNGQCIPLYCIHDMHHWTQKLIGWKWRIDWFYIIKYIVSSWLVLFNPFSCFLGEYFQSKAINVKVSSIFNLIKFINKVVNQQFEMPTFLTYEIFPFS